MRERYTDDELIARQHTMRGYGNQKEVELGPELLAARARIAELQRYNAQLSGLLDIANEERKKALAKLAEFEPRALKPGDDFLTGSVDPPWEYVANFQGERFPLTPIICRIVRIPVPRAAEPPEPRAHAGEAWGDEPLEPLDDPDTSALDEAMDRFDDERTMYGTASDGLRQPPEPGAAAKAEAWAPRYGDRVMDAGSAFLGRMVVPPDPFTPAGCICVAWDSGKVQHVRLSDLSPAPAQAAEAEEPDSDDPRPVFSAEEARKPYRDALMFIVRNSTDAGSVRKAALTLLGDGGGL